MIKSVLGGMALALALALSGCQSIPTTEMVQDAAFWHGMQAKLKTIQEVSLLGRANIVHEDLRFSANYQYQGSSSHHYSLNLTTSLGEKLFSLRVEPGFAQLMTQGRTFAADNPQELFAQVAKMELPLNSFHELIMGMALPETEGLSLFNDAGILAQSQVPNFIITYRGYQTVEDLALPSEIEITGPATRILLFNRTIQSLERTH